MNSSHYEFAVFQEDLEAQLAQPAHTCRNTINQQAHQAVHTDLEVLEDQEDPAVQADPEAQVSKYCTKQDKIQNLQ